MTNIDQDKSARNRLLSLEKRIEALTAPCREMDAEIAIAAKAVPYDFEPAYWTAEWREMYGDRIWTAPQYTASLDAAMTLVPDGWSVGLGDLRGYSPVIWRAHLRDHNEPYNPSSCNWQEGHATTAALALCAAGLRARAGQMQ